MQPLARAGQEMRMTASAEQQRDLESLKGLIGWFNHSSVELIDEYRRLEERIDDLNAELRAKNEELQESLRAREESRAFLHSVLESLRGGVLVLDQSLRPTFVNRELLGLAGEIDHRRVLQLLGERLAANLRQGEQKFLPLECEKVLQGPNGAMTPVHFSVAQVASGSKDCCYVIVFQDITVRKRLEAEAARTRRLASLGVMASEIAHQVKSPLGGIELYASLLKEKSRGEPKRLAGEILCAVRRLSTTLSHLLAFAAEPVISADVLSVAALMKDLLEDCMPLFDDPRFSMVVAIEADLPPIWADCGLLVQALLNLVINAKEAMPGGGRVTLKTGLAPFSASNGQIHKAIEIKIVDEGIGIAAENRERIFDPFFSTKQGGTGLGLAFAHKIISAHRGSIEIASTPGRGSEFLVLLPAAEEI
jgi:signal transduction histidine kinase